MYNYILQASEGYQRERTGKAKEEKGRTEGKGQVGGAGGEKKKIKNVTILLRSLERAEHDCDGTNATFCFIYDVELESPQQYNIKKRNITQKVDNHWHNIKQSKSGVNNLLEQHSMFETQVLPVTHPRPKIPAAPITCLLCDPLH